MENNIEQIISERIGFWLRAGAYLIDIVFVFLFGYVLTLFVGDFFLDLFFGNQMADMNEQMNEIQHLSPKSNQFINPFMSIVKSWMSISAGAAFAGLILVVLEGIFGQSVGKFILGIKVTDLDGGNLPSQKLWLRSGLKYGNNIIALIGSMSGLMVISVLGSFWGMAIFVGFFLTFMDNKQTIHDMIAKTVVSKK
ncbi:MAG: RDD family protein [Flavobacteriales bacterium]|nr:RDD family protein [Flavobacteriales bacterium]